MRQPFLSYGEPDLCHDYKLKDPGYIDCFCINFPSHCVLRQVLLDTNLLDNVVLWKEVVQPTKKPRSVGPHKSKLENTTSKKKTRLKTKKFKSMNTQIPEKPKNVMMQMPVPAWSRSREEAMIPKHLVKMDKDPKKHSYINSSTSIRNIFNKELLVGLVKFNRALKIQTGGELIQLLQIRF